MISFLIVLIPMLAKRVIRIPMMIAEQKPPVVVV